MAIPTLLPASTREEIYGGVVYHIEGELVPVLHVELGNVPVYFEHNILLWKDPHTQIELKPLKGAFKRVLSGMPVLLAQARGPGRIAFSRDGVGHALAMHLKPGEMIDVREQQFLAATDTVEYGFERVKGAANMQSGGGGFFIDTFTGTREAGILWLHGYGNVFEVNLKPGEQIDVEPGGWIYKDRSVQMQTIVQRLAAGLVAGAPLSRTGPQEQGPGPNAPRSPRWGPGPGAGWGPGQIFWNRFTGPGRIGLQSMRINLSAEE